MCRITLERGETPIAHCSVQVESLQLDQFFLAIFPSYCDHKIVIKYNLPILLMPIRQQEKSQKYFDLSAFDWNLNRSDMLSTLGATNF